MKERLEEILSHYGLTSSKLADILKVQRSGISHILSGRNNPGYDFLVRIVEEFPEINANWLLTGKGNMLKEEGGGDGVSRSDRTHEIPSGSDQASLFRSESIETKSESEIETDKQVYISKQERVLQGDTEKVIILKQDGTFIEYIHG